MLVSLHLRPRKITSLYTYTQESMNLVFANQEDEEAIYALTTREIAEAQKHDLIQHNG